ncbi:MAG: molybdenum cofactor guanylyltransferase [Oscillospiraceae bacterium]|nr:molybdenum cofactor guanylyltransferase [Oscillospiraceae bacterium]
MSGNVTTIACGAGTVKKTFRSTVSMDKERAARGVAAPCGLAGAVLAAEGNTLTVEAPSGTPLTAAADEGTVWALTDWLKRFDGAAKSAFGKSVVLSDFALEQFCTTGGKVFGTDFAAWRFGASYENHAALTAALRLAGRAELADRLMGEGARQYGVPPEALLQAAERWQLHFHRRETRRPLLDGTTAVLLAGGKSSRMGRPKHRLDWEGYPFWEHILHTARPFCHAAASVARRQPEFEGRLPQWEDERQEVGPVGALSTIFRRAETPLALMLSCDAPFLTEEVFCLLLDALQDGDDCVIPSVDGRSSPLLGLYRRKALAAADEALERGERRVRAVLEKLRVREVQVPPSCAEALRNINTPEDYKKALAGREGGAP